MSANENRPDTTGTASEPHHELSADYTAHTAPSEALDPGMCLIAAAMRSTAQRVKSLPVVSGDLPGLTEIWEAITTLADEGVSPDPSTVLARLNVAGMKQQQTVNRLTRAVTLTCWPEQVGMYAAAVLAQRYRDGFKSLAVSLDSAVDTAAEPELERLLADHRAQLLDIHQRLQVARAVTA